MDDDRSEKTTPQSFLLIIVRSRENHDTLLLCQLVPLYLKQQTRLIRGRSRFRLRWTTPPSETPGHEEERKRSPGYQGKVLLEHEKTTNACSQPKLRHYTAKSWRCKATSFSATQVFAMRSASHTQPFPRCCYHLAAWASWASWRRKHGGRLRLDFQNGG
jgi:hypothetical protein